MGRFLEAEKLRQERFKAEWPTFSNAARECGYYRTKWRSYCLPREHCEENLFSGIRESVLAYFRQHDIKWHDGKNLRPSNHMCSSQICCVNFLGAFAHQPRALETVLRPIFPDLREMCQIEAGRYVAFEWIGSEDYLGEKLSRHGKRTRGANFTSADAAVLFTCTDGTQQAVLIEWKYTESYSRTCLALSKSGTNRTDIYRPLFERDDCPIDKTLLPAFEALFYEPFYQLLRQQLLTHEMERAGELGAQRVSLLHIAPAHNTDFWRITSPALADRAEILGNSPTTVWSRLTAPYARFHSVSTETLFGDLSPDNLPEMSLWLEYIAERYPWVRSRARLDV